VYRGQAGGAVELGLDVAEVASDSKRVDSNREGILDLALFAASEASAATCRRTGLARPARPGENERIDERQRLWL
jgi:hypothetical protein